LGRHPLSVSTTRSCWLGQVKSLLERNKRYPADARSRREMGTVELAFTLDRQGRVIASRIVHSSGSNTLAQGTLDLVRRTQPFPPPPAAVTGKQFDLKMPIRFNIH
jgi:protein TonB